MKPLTNCPCCREDDFINAITTLHAKQGKTNVPTFGDIALSMVQEQREASLTECNKIDQFLPRFSGSEERCEAW